MDERLKQFADAMCEDTATAEEVAELDGLLKDSRAMQDAYLAYMQLHGALAWRHREAHRQVVAEPETSSAFGAGRWRRVGWAVGLAAAAAVALAVTLGLLSSGIFFSLYKTKEKAG